MIWLSESILISTALVVPNFTAVAPVKLLPLMMTDVPPLSGPLFGLMLLIHGDGGVGVGGTNSKRSAADASLAPLGVATTMSTFPVPEGETALIVSSRLTTNDVALEAPKWTAVAPVNPVPRMVTVVPPAVEPWLGETLTTVGGGGVTSA